MGQAHLIHPDERRDPWLTTGQLVWCGVGLALWSPILMILNPFTPPVWGILASVLAIVVLAVSGRGLPARVPGGPRASVPRMGYGLVAGVNTTAVFVAVFLLPEVDPPWLPAWPVTVAFVVVADAIAVWAILRWSASGTGWDDRHRLALVIGMLSFFVVVDVAADVQGPFGGLSLVAVLAVVALVRLWTVTTRRVGSPTAVVRRARAGRVVVRWRGSPSAVRCGCTWRPTGHVDIERCLADPRERGRGLRRTGASGNALVLLRLLTSRGQRLPRHAVRLVRSGAGLIRGATGPVAYARPGMACSRPTAAIRRGGPRCDGSSRPDDPQAPA
jgi:hypothetical protein